MTLSEMIFWSGCNRWKSVGCECGEANWVIKSHNFKSSIKELKKDIQESKLIWEPNKDRIIWNIDNIFGAELNG